MKRILAIGISIVFLITACKKGIGPEEASKSSTKVEHYTAPIYVQNSSNPKDWVGKLHNDGLIYAFEHATSNNLDDILLSCFEFMYNSSEYNQYATGTPQEMMNEVDQIIAHQSLLDFPGTPGYQYDFDYITAYNSQTNTLSAQFIAYNSQMMTIAANYGATNDINFYNEIKTIESNVLSDQTLTNLEKQILLSQGSVTRFTTYLWANAPSEPEFPIDFDNMQALDWFDDDEASKADMEGLVNGAVGGAITGSFIPGFGTLAGAFTGGLGGMWGGSAANVVGQWLDSDFIIAPGTLDESETINGHIEIGISSLFDDTEVVVIDLAGNIVHSETVNINTQAVLDFSFLPAGNYELTIQDASIEYELQFEI